MNESDRELAEKIWSKPGKATKTSDEWIADVAELIAAHCEQMARGAKLNGAMDVLLQIRSFRKSYPTSTGTHVPVDSGAAETLEFIGNLYYEYRKAIDSSAAPAASGEGTMEWVEIECDCDPEYRHHCFHCGGAGRIRQRRSKTSSPSCDCHLHEHQVCDICQAALGEGAAQPAFLDTEWGGDNGPDAAQPTCTCTPLTNNNLIRLLNPLCRVHAAQPGDGKHKGG
jgi:hypothetical protein